MGVAAALISITREQPRGFAPVGSEVGAQIHAGAAADAQTRCLNVVGQFMGPENRWHQDILSGCSIYSFY
jgi:hypothetical protein